MFKNIKKAALATLLLLLPLGSAQAMEPVMAASDLSPGMTGYAKTVILGRDIETFDVEILGVIQNGKYSEGRILAKASGDVIEKSGGVLQGMSGSPVYVNGYLIGAVSGGWKDIDNHLCTITPIGDMLKLWQLPDARAEKKVPQVDIKKASETLRELRAAAEKTSAKADEKENEKESGEEKNPAEINEEGDDAFHKIFNENFAENSREAGIDAKAENNPINDALATPLMVGGLSARSMDFLAAELKGYNMVPYNAGVGSADNAYFPAASLEAGSSVGVELVRGDISIAAIGTVTAIDGDKVLAFGHSFLHRGNVGYFMTEADIISTASGLNSGFKIGVPGRAVGTINQDRNDGVSGKIGVFPAVIPMQITVDDKGTASNKRYDVQLAYHEELVPVMAATVVYNAIEKTMDTATEGTVKISFEIATNDGGGKKITRDNMYYAAQNVSQLSINELAEILSTLCSNTTKEADIFNIKANIEVDDKRRTASIVEIKPDKTKAKPGDTLNVQLTLKPYRGEKQQLTIPFTVPKSMPHGTALLEARGGGLVTVAQLTLAGIDLSPEEDKNKTVEMQVKELTEKNKNNEIILDMVSVPDESAAKTKAKNKSGDKVQEIHKPVKETTDYIIDNVIRAAVVIEKK